MNEKLERQYKERWLERTDAISMDRESLVQIVIAGHETCPTSEPCLSRIHSGNDACRCIRTIFPTPEHYELYQRLRTLLLEMELTTAINGDTHANR